MRESDIVSAIRLAVGRDPDVVIWRNSGGVATAASGNVQRFGLCVGAADLIGICRGRFLALEVKTGSGRVTVEQEMFLLLVRRKGGFAAVVRSVAEAAEAIGRCKAGGVE